MEFLTNYTINRLAMIAADQSAMILEYKAA